MNRFFSALALFSFGLNAAPATGHEHAHGARVHSHQSGGSFAAGHPGKADKARRTIRIRALDTMRFEPSGLSIKKGETVRLVFTNDGQLPHEAVIGSAAEQQAHEAEMAAMQDSSVAMEHHHANAVSLPPGETRELVWQFGKPGRFEIGCHLPGHYAAGMVGRVTVR
jgi:uncharacterized cupredoxin-like copper-binding protein